MLLARPPDDAACADEYAKGPTANVAEVALKNLAAIAPADADPEEVARAIVRGVALTRRLAIALGGNDGLDAADFEMLDEAVAIIVVVLRPTWPRHGRGGLEANIQCRAN